MLFTNLYEERFGESTGQRAAQIPEKQRKRSPCLVLLD